MKCVMQGTCKARIILDEDQELYSPIPVHSHTSQEAAIEVCKAKNNIKRLASTTDNTTKNIIASSLSTLDYEGVTKLNCQIPSLSKMSRRARQHSNLIPPIPDSLEHMAFNGFSNYITSERQESMLLWGSNWSASDRRSLMFGSLDNIHNLSDADHFFIDGTFSSSPNIFSQMLSVHG